MQVISSRHPKRPQRLPRTRPQERPGKAPRTPPKGRPSMIPTNGRADSKGKAGKVGLKLTNSERSFGNALVLFVQLLPRMAEDPPD